MIAATATDAPPSEGDVALDLAGIAAALKRSRIFIGALALGLGLFTLFVSSALPPRFDAETKVLIERREIDLGTESGDSSALVVDREAVASQVQLLTSRDLARRVAQRLDLASTDEFGAPGSMLAPVLQLFGFARETADSDEERIVSAFLEHLTVFQIENARVIVVQFASRDADRAAAAANAVVEEYMAIQAEAQRSSNDEETRWLLTEIERLRTAVAEAEGRVAAFRSGSDLFVTAEGQGTLVQQQLTELTAEVARARAAAADADAKATQLRGLLESGGSLETTTEITSSDTFRALRDREIAIRSRISELSVTLLSGHPQIRALTSQLADIEAQVRGEAQQILVSLENDARLAAARVASLNADIDELKATSAEDDTREVEARALEREATSQRDLLEGLLVRYREAVARQSSGIMPADARVISRATRPEEASFPKPIPFAVLATIAGLMIGVALVLAREFLSGRAVRNVALIPPTRVPELLIVADAPPVPFRRSLRARIDALTKKVAPRESPPPLVGAPVGAPAVAGEPGAERGESARVAVLAIKEDAAADVVADSLATDMTAEGDRVVVVNLRRRGSDRALQGLADLVAGEANFAEVIRRGAAGRAHVIELGSRPVSAEELQGESFANVLATLEQTYDLVVLNVGALDSTASRYAVLSSCDHVVLAANLSVDAALVERTEALLRENGVPAISVVDAPSRVAA